MTISEILLMAILVLLLEQRIKASFGVQIFDKVLVNPVMRLLKKLGLRK